MAQNYTQFAASIKAKYPQYKDMDDLELSKKIVAKYPVYKDKVTLYGDGNTSKFQGGMEYTSGNFFSGGSRVIGGFVDLTGRAVAAASKGAGIVGSGIYRGVGNLGTDGWEKAWDRVADDFKANQYQFAERFQAEGTKLNSLISEGGQEAKEIILSGNERYQRIQDERNPDLEKKYGRSLNTLDREAAALEEARKELDAFPDEFASEEEYNAAQAKVDEYNSNLESFNKKAESLDKQIQETVSKAESANKFSYKDLAESDFWVHDVYQGLVENAPIMAASLYTGGAAGTALKLSSPAMKFLGQVGASTMVSTGLNASIEAESAYKAAIEEGLSEEEALRRADNVFRRNGIGNLGFEGLQMMMLFMPQFKSVSPFMNAIFKTGEVGLAGVTESFQERAEDSIQSQAGYDKFDWNKLGDDLAASGISRTDATSFFIGAFMQGAGNAFVSDKTVSNALKQRIEDIVERLPDDGQGGTPEEKLERAIEENPSQVEQIAEEIRQDAEEVSGKVRDAAKAERLTDLAEQAIESGRSKAEVALALSGEIGAEQAQSIVDAIPEPRVTVDIPTAEELMAGSTKSLQDSLNTLETKFDEETAAIREDISRLQQEVKAAPANSQAKASLKKTLEEKRTEYNTKRDDFDAAISDNASQLRDAIEQQIAGLKLPKNEVALLSEKIVDKLFTPGLDVPVTALINNEMGKFRSVRTASPDDITKAIRKVSPSEDAKRNQALADEVIATIQDEKFKDIVSELSLEDVVEQVAKSSDKYQVKNTTRGANGKAKFENIHREDFEQVMKFLEAVRSGKEVPLNVDIAARRLAERYGMNPDATPKRLANAFELRIGKSAKLDALADDILLKGFSQTKVKVSEKKKPVPFRFAKQIKDIPLFEHVPIAMVKEITDGKGRAAFGRFYRNMVEFTEDADITTIPHESFHVFSQLALTDKERKTMYNEARKAYGRPHASNFDIEETLAQDFAEYYVDGKTPKTFSQKLIEIFKKLAQKLADMVTGKSRETIESIFRDVTTKRVADRVRERLKNELPADQLIELRQSYYQNPTEFTLRLFDNPIFKKETIGYQETLQAIKSMNLKKGENLIHELVLERPEFKDMKKFDAKQYRRTVLGEMLQFRVVESGTYANYGLENIGIDTSDPDSSGYIESYTQILDTNFEHGEGQQHFKEAKGMHSHFRGGMRHDEGAFKMLEMQSDTFQRDVPQVTEETIRGERQKKVLAVYQGIQTKINALPDFQGDAGWMQSDAIELVRDLKIAGVDTKNIDKYGSVKQAEKSIKNKDDYASFLNEAMLEAERQEQDIFNEPLSEEEKAYIALSQQFAAMKNSWYELTLRTAIRKAAEMGAEYFDMADTRTLANIESYVGERGQIEARGGQFSVEPRDAEINDIVEYLGSYESTVVETMHDTNTLGIVYAPDGGQIDTIHESDAKFNLREDLEDTYEFSSRYDSEIMNDFYHSILTAEERQEIADQTVEGGTEEIMNLALDSENDSIREKAEEFKQDTIDKAEENFDFEEYYADLYGQNAIYRYYDRRYDQWYVAYNRDGETLEHVEAPYGNTPDTDFDLNSLEDSHARIAAKYGVNEIDGKQREGDFYKYLKKIRPDLEQFNDGNDFNWWRTKITPEDSLDVPLYQMPEDVDNNEASIFTDLHNKMEEIMEFLEAGIEYAGVSYVTDSYGSIIGRASSYPSYIPKHLRSKSIIEPALEKYKAGKEIKSANQQEFIEVFEEQLMSMLPPELQDQKVINDYIIEQEKVADALRTEAIQLAHAFAKTVGKRVAKLKKGDVKKTIRHSTGQIRTDTKEFSRKLKSHARYYNRGYKTGYKTGATDKLAAMLSKTRATRERNAKIARLKSIYRRTKQATKSGAYLPIEYQNRLTELFDSIDFTKMRKSTQKQLEKTAEFFEAQGGDVPQHIAEKLKRLSKIAVGNMNDEQLTELLEVAQRIFENGLLKKKLVDSRDAKQFQAKLDELVETSVNLNDKENMGTIRKVADFFKLDDATKINFKIFDPARFADIVDGMKDYAGANFRYIIEPIRFAIDNADNQTNALLAEAFEDIKSFSDTYSDEQMARIMHTSALEQDAEAQADALVKQYPDFDFTTPLTEEERGALETMKDVFKEIRPQLAAVFEAEKNIPFPDNPNYFPFRYDRDVEMFDINDNAFDFAVTKTAQGFTMSREKVVDRVLDINVFDTFARQVSQQLYYANVQPSLSFAKDVFNSKSYQKAVGKVVHDYWSDFITHVARRGNGADFPGRQFIDNIRGNISTAILGYKLSTIAIQPSAIFDAMIAMRKEFGQVAAMKMLPNLLKMFVKPSALNASIEQSRALQNRQGGQIEIYELRNAARGEFAESRLRRGWHLFKQHAYDGIRATDMRTAAAVYDSFYREYIKQGLDVDAATARAEQMMMLSQSSANVVNRPQVLNNSLVKFFMPFQTFIVNSFNNIRYDAIDTELKKRGKVAGTAHALLNMQFIVYAVAYEAAMYSTISALFGYEDDEDETFLKKMLIGALGRIPGSGYFFNFSGEFEGVRTNNPAIEAFSRALESANDIRTALFAEDEKVDNKDIYNVVKSVMTLLGVAGTQQTHQILTAPDVAGMGSIGRNLQISYDDRTNAEKREDVVGDYLEGGTISAETIDEIARKVYGSDYTDGGVEYRASKKAEVIREVALRQEFGFDNEFVNVNLQKKNNNEVKAYYAANPEELKKYRKPVKLFGVDNTLMSDQLYKELRYIENASPEEKAKIAALAAAETDAERKKAIGGDKDFAKRAFSNYKIISKVFYESI